MTSKKKLAGAFGGIVAVGATVALTAGTFSYFSDSATANGGSADVNFGKLTLALGDEADAVQPVNLDHAAPGDTVFDRDLSFRNTGDMAGELRIAIVENDNNTTAFNRAVRIQLAGVSEFDSTQSYTLEQVADRTAGGLHLYTLWANAGDESVKGIHMKVTLDPEAGNAVQGASGGFKLLADLRQADTSDGRAKDQDNSFPAKPASKP